MAGMWVVFNSETGESTEDMRFPARLPANEYIEQHEDPERGVYFDKRWESDSPHPRNEVAVGQIWRDGRWLDFARDTPEVAIAWAEKEPVGLARVRDWVGGQVIWP